MGVRDARCPYCGAPPRSAKPLSAHGLPSAAPLTPAERGAGKLAPGVPTVPKPTAANKTQPKVSN